MASECPICYGEFSPSALEVARGKDGYGPAFETDEEQGSQNDGNNANHTTTVDTNVDTWFREEDADVDATNNDRENARKRSSLEVDSGDGSDSHSRHGAMEDTEGGMAPATAITSATPAATVGSVHPITVPGCQHTFCRQCLTQYCIHSIESNEMPIICPMQQHPACSTRLDEELVKELLLHPADDTDVVFGDDNDDNDDHDIGSNLVNGNPSQQRHQEKRQEQQRRSKLWQRFRRSQQMLQDPTLAACTRCSGLCSKENDQDAGLKAVDATSVHQLSCPTCNHHFCSIHGDAHRGKTCQQAKKIKRSKETKRSEKVIRKFTKPCSHCSVPIHKEAGCDHVVCPSCHKDFCFRCGKHEHLTGTTMRSCSLCQQSYIDHRYMWVFRLYTILYLPFYLPFALLYTAFATAISLATCGCCCCLFCGARVNDNAPHSSHAKSHMRDGANDADYQTFTQNDPTKVSSFSPSTTTATTPGAAATASYSPKQADRPRIQYNPLRGIRATLSILLCPFTVIAGECGIPCCLSDEDIEEAQTMELSDNEDE